jgi:hypothetical protein
MKRLSFTQWLRIYILRAPVDYGEGLYLMPKSTRERSYEKWASGMWTEWESGSQHFFVNMDAPEECPACYYVGLAEQSSYLADHHHDGVAQRRWRESAAIERAQAAALGPCRCGQKLTPVEAASRSAQELARYGDFRG